MVDKLDTGYSSYPFDNGSPFKRLYEVNTLSDEELGTNYANNLKELSNVRALRLGIGAVAVISGLGWLRTGRIF